MTARSPHDSSTRTDVVVAGGGVIGLAIAWQAARRGMAVLVADPEPGRGASWAAAGMLAPVTEVHYGEEALLELNLASAYRWAAFADDVQAASGQSIEYLPCGTLLVAADDGDRAWAEDLLRFQRELSLDVQWLTAREARALEPDLAPGIRAALWAPADHQVDNRLLLAGLEHAAQRAGARFHRARVETIETAGGVATGVLLGDGSAVACDAVVIAAGWQSGTIAGLPADAVPPVRPVKGQILRLSPAVGGPRLSRSVRGIVEGASVYLVPRRDGTIVVGATVEERGDDTEVTAGAVYELLRDARRVVPAVSELGLAEAMAGLRPGSPDNGPLIGWLPGLQGVLVATGHYRNGILLTPITSAAVVALLCGETPPAQTALFGPQRLREVPC
ncbi:MAG: glycine oxidase ThiO [Acidimicrobiales bacterium]